MAKKVEKRASRAKAAARIDKFLESALNLTNSFREKISLIIYHKTLN
jgi:hypothetical protein